ncbi:hypothetical protein THAR02_00960 [Trichoderma harzianum]|uniref:Uncharacterized protein n=1 Tax=Trichoderma harzianum TaxID=5544 RepID=A0A0G0AQT4_TRIHA|nr:hypothetical protein THAR02_00960 [Trichoderma harzianum]
MPSSWRESTCTWWSESRSFYKLLFNFGSSEATDSRDLVYALRGISSDLTSKCDDPLFPDYKKSQRKLVQDVIQYIYDFDTKHLAETPLLSSMGELATNLPRLETDICRYLAGMSLPDHMERILKRSEILVTKDMIKAAAQYDKDGKVVNVLLRCCGAEFKIDDEVLLCAAANSNATKGVFEAFWYHQNQLVITEEILIATAKSAKSGHSAMCFLLSLKTQVYRITPILEAIDLNTSEYSRREIVRMLLLQKDYRNDTIPEVLAAAAEIREYGLQTEVIKTMLQQKDCKNDTIPEVLAAAAKIQYYDLQADIIKALLQQKSSSDITISDIIAAADNIRGSDLQTEIIEMLLQKKSNSNNIISEVITAVLDIRDSKFKIKIIKMLLQQKGSNDNIISEVITATADIRGSNLHAKIIMMLLQKKANNNDIISKVISTAKRQDIFLTKDEMIEILLEQKGNGNDIISTCLTFAVFSHFGHTLIRDFVRKNPGFEISRDVVIIAMKSWPNYTDSLKSLYHYFPSLNSSRKQVA